jgi:hypothetical protein
MLIVPSALLMLTMPCSSALFLQVDLSSQILRWPDGIEDTFFVQIV